MLPTVWATAHTGGAFLHALGGLVLHRACLIPECLFHAMPGMSRCPTHQRAFDGAKRAKRASAPGDGAASRVRGRVRGAELLRCNGCGHWYPPSGIEVDHKLALADGGTDTENNLQLLCLSCHVAKTSEENRQRTVRRGAKGYVNRPRY